MTGTGVHPLPSDAYHADNVADTPSLSASIAHKICSQSPAHAYASHPRLNPDYKREEKEHFDLGTVVHAAILEPDRTIVKKIFANDWRTKSAREERDEARAEGKIPLLEHQVDEVLAMVVAVREQLDAHGARPPLFHDGAAEQTLVWDEDGVVCRARPDWLRVDARAIDDLKTTSKSADPEKYSRALFGVGGDVQCAFYLRGVHALTGAVPEFRWAVVETTPPYALAVISPAPDVIALGHRKVDHALKVWRECLASGEWPGYPSRVCYANAPPWEEARWLEREGLAA